MAGRAAALAGGLRERGVGVGDVVGLLSYNCPEFLETIFAANYLGAIAMPINWRLAAPEVRYILEHSEARALVCDESLVDLGERGDEGHGGHARPRAASRARPRTAGRRSPNCAPRPTSPARVARAGRRRPPPDVHVGHDGPPQGRHAHPRQPGVEEPRAHRRVRLHRAPTSGSPAGPLYHVGALDLTTTSLIAAGATTIIHRAFDAADVVDEIERSRVTTVWLAPAMVNAIMALPDVEQRDLSSVRVDHQRRREDADPAHRADPAHVPLGLVRRRVRPHRDRLRRHLPRPRQHRHQARQRRPPVPLPRARHLGRAGEVGARGRARRDRPAGPQGVQGLLARPRGDRRPRSRAAGSTPATSASATTTATCTSSTGSRT